jgi:hypothetical protein
VIALGLIPDRTIADGKVAQRVLELIEVDEHHASRARFIPVADSLKDRPVRISCAGSGARVVCCRWKHAANALLGEVIVSARSGLPVARAAA